MQNIFGRLTLILFLVCGVFVSGFSPARAQETLPTEVVSELAETDSEQAAVSRGPIFLADEEVIFTEIHDGPLFVAAGQAIFAGEVRGDLVVFGGSITLDGTVQQDVYVAGGTVLINGQVGGNVIAAGGEVHMGETAQVGQSVIIGGESVAIHGSVGHQAYVGARQVRFQGSIQDDVHVMAEKISVEDQAMLGGKMTGETKQTVEVAETAAVSDGVAVEVKERTPRQSRASFYWWISKAAVTVVSFTVIMVLMIMLFGKRLESVSLSAVENWQSSVITGIVLFTSLVLGSLVLFLTVLGLQAAVILLFLALGLGALGWIIPAFFFGQWFFSKRGLYLQGILGAVITGFLVSLPLFGWLIGVFLTVFGAGALFQVLRRE